MSTDSPFLIVGLGNPGPKYANTRHNVGFKVIEELERRWGGLAIQEKFKAHLAQTDREGRRVFLLKPQTYMNLSGEAVREALTFYKIPMATDLLVITDDLDLPPAALRLRMNGGSGGHNGISSIIENLGGEGFARLRIGIGRSATIPTESYVLGKIPKDEEALFSEALKLAADGVELILKDGWTKAMNTVNQKRKTV